MDGNIESIELEKGKIIYEVEIENSQLEYDIYIDAYTGEVLESEKDAEVDDDLEEREMEQSISANLISELQAIHIAESVVEGTVVEMGLGEDDGLIVYELELRTKLGKVEVEVDALTGEVLNNK